jgi:CCR4-NOT transcription complex subunit 4
MRVIQKNLVYVIGLAPKITGDELLPILRSADFFGQYGKIQKIVINKHKPSASSSSSSQGLGIYVTFYNREDAAKAIEAIDGSVNEGRVVRASHGTTKYCTSYLRNQPCTNPSCMYLHEPGDDIDSYTREDLSTL